MSEQPTDEKLEHGIIELEQAESKKKSREGAYKKQAIVDFCLTCQASDKLSGTGTRNKQQSLLKFFQKLIGRCQQRIPHRSERRGIGKIGLAEPGNG